MMGRLAISATGSPSRPGRGVAEWAEAYAARLDPLHHALVTSPEPPARREVLRELAKVDAYAYPWPLDADARWVLSQEQPTDWNVIVTAFRSQPASPLSKQDRGEGSFMRRS